MDLIKVTGFVLRLATDLQFARRKAIEAATVALQAKMSEAKREPEAKLRAAWEIQFWRRAACRNLFGLLEAWVSVLRGRTIPFIFEKYAREHQRPEDQAERDFIEHLLTATQAYEWTLDHMGMANPQKRKLRLMPLLRACIRLVFILTGGLPKEQFDQFFKDPLWGRLGQAIKLRDRLMHPHEPDDIDVDDKEFENLNRVSDALIILIETEFKALFMALKQNPPVTAQ